MIDLKRILVPMDFSKHSLVALKYAVAFGQKFGAQIHLLHVLQDLALFFPDAVTVVPPIEQLTETVQVSLERVLREHHLENQGIQLAMRTGSPFHEIAQYAKDENVDLIIMGTHGRGSLMHLLMGSVAEKVVRKAPCPVLTVRDPEHEFVHD